MIHHCYTTLNIPSSSASPSPTAWPVPIQILPHCRCHHHCQTLSLTHWLQQPSCPWRPGLTWCRASPHQRMKTQHPRSPLSAPPFWVHPPSVQSEFFFLNGIMLSTVTLQENFEVQVSINSIRLSDSQTSFLLSLF